MSLPPAAPPLDPQPQPPAPDALAVEMPVPEATSLPMPAPETRSARKPLLAALGTTVVVTALSYLTPAKYAGAAVGLAFLAATWVLVLRKDEHTIRAHGLSLGGLLEPLPLDPKRIVRESAGAMAWVLGLSLLVFPAFWYGFKIFWHVKMPFAWKLPRSPLEEVAGQLLVVALPEEAFFRGYLQTELEAVWTKRVHFLGFSVGFGWLVSAAIFAIGHLLTIPAPTRLAVFFPALLFGLLRARTGGVGAGVVFHALCNLFSSLLAHGYGLST